MRILLTNDDGIRAPGIVAMHDALTDRWGVFGGFIEDKTAGAVSRSPRTVVYPIAPLTVQSATSHGVTFHTPVRGKEEQVNELMTGIGVDGRPADCVKLALAGLWPDRFGPGERPELCISGMNAGANCGINVIYSGTVAAAIEAAFLGVPSIAVSMMLGKGKPRFDVGATWARRVIEMLLRDGPPRAHECLSILDRDAFLSRHFGESIPRFAARHRVKESHARTIRTRAQQKFEDLHPPGVLTRWRVIELAEQWWDDRRDGGHNSLVA